ncbi:MAG: hypothetical protein DIU68_001605 [Chloroflexota bacterium]
MAIVIYGQPGNPASTVGGPQPVMAIKGALDGMAGARAAQLRGHQ